MYSTYFKPFPTLETERLILRKVKKSDAKDLFVYCGSARSAKYAEWEEHEDIGVTKQFISWLLSTEKRGEYMTWAIELKESGRVIGTCSFTSMDKAYKVAELGYGIISECWGKGLAKEAVGAILEYGFCNIGLCRIFARIMKDNTSSVHLAASLGMECEGFMRKAVWCKGGSRDLYYYGITDDDYKRMLEKEKDDEEDKELRD